MSAGPRPLLRSLASWLTLGAALAGPPARAVEGPGPRLVLPALPGTGEPDAAAIGRARAAYDEAARRFAAGRFAESLPFARAAFADLPNASSSLIVATVLAELDRPCDAVSHLVLALDLGPQGDEPALIDKLLVDQAPRCGAGLGWLRVTASDGVEVDVGGATVKAPRTIALAADTWSLAARAPGRDESRQDVTIAAGRGLSIHLDAGPPSPPVVVGPDPIEPEPSEVPSVVPSVVASLDDPPRDAALGWALVGSGAAALVASAICFGAAVGEVDRAERIVARAATPPDEADRRALADAHEATRALEIGGWVTGVVGAAAAIWGAVTLLDDDTPTVGLGVGSGGAALVLGRRF